MNPNLADSDGDGEVKILATFFKGEGGVGGIWGKDAKVDPIFWHEGLSREMKKDAWLHGVWSPKKDI